MSDPAPETEETETTETEEREQESDTKRTLRIHEFVEVPGRVECCVIAGTRHRLNHAYVYGRWRNLEWTIWPI